MMASGCMARANWKRSRDRFFQSCLSSIARVKEDHKGEWEGDGGREREREGEKKDADLQH